MVHLDQKQIRIGALILAVMIGMIGYYFYTTLQTTEEETFSIKEETMIEESETKEEMEEQIIVHIAGEVKKPGIIKTKEGARMADIIEQAGGLNPEADITNINLAYPVEDGQKIIIPKKGEQIQEETGKENKNNIIITQENSNKKININKASSEELQTLQGIGESTAQKIITYRTEHRKLQTN